MTIRDVLLPSFSILVASVVLADEPQNPHDVRRSLAVESASKVLTRLDSAAAPDEYARYGDALLRAGRIQDAIEQFENYLRLRPACFG